MRFLKGVGLVFVILLALAVGFTAGFFFDRQALLPVTGVGSPLGGVTAPTPSPGKLSIDLIQEAAQIIRQEFADRQTLEKTNLTYAAISGMVDALGDTGHSVFMSPDVVAADKRGIEGEFEGIGALLNVNEEGNPVIAAPFDGSPAQKAGLRPGDIIIAVDGFDVSHAALTEVVRRVIGPAGTKVTLTIRNPETKKERDVTITRAKIVIHNVTWVMLPGTNVAHIRISQYSNNVTQDLIKAMGEARAQGAKGFVLDLRNNPGGLLNEAIGVASQFLKTGNVMQTKDSEGKITNVPVMGGGKATDIPMVVLINQGSASASEITAGAMQDYKRATLVGEKTFGTGTVLNTYRLSDGSALRLAAEMWLTPKGRVIWHQGITPDVVVELPADANPSFPETEREMTAADLQNVKDTQLKKALDLIQAIIK